MSRLRGISKTTAAIALGVILVVIVGVVALTTDLGGESVPDDAVAVVDGTPVSVDDFNKALEQAAKGQGLQEVPAEDDPQYEAIRDEALNSVLDTQWILGEAEEQGIEVSDRELEQEFEQTKKENFKTEQEYQDFLKESGFTQEDVDLRVRLQVLSTKIQEQITEDAGGVTEKDAEEFYEANKDQFTQPETRNVRLVLNEDEKEAQEAADELSQDNSPESWDKVAKDLSTDPQSKDNGGVRENVTEGTFGPELDGELFSAAQGEVVGPVSTSQGFYVFQVDEITEARDVPLDEAREQIDQQLEGQIQQDAFAAFLGDYRDRWVEVTYCSDDFLLPDRCNNADPESQPCPDPTLPPDQQQAQLEQSGCPPPVLSISPAPPGSILPFTPAQAQPQRPHGPGGEAPPAAPQGVPGGAPIPGGAPGAAPPAGAAPPSGAAPPPG